MNIIYLYLFPLLLICLILHKLCEAIKKETISVLCYVLRKRVKANTNVNTNANIKIKSSVNSIFRKVYAKRNIKFDELVTQKDISKINNIVLALLEFKKIHSHLNVPPNYILKSKENENLKSFQLWKKLEEIKNEKKEKKKMYIYFILKKLNFPLETIFTEEEIRKFEKKGVDVTTMSELSKENHVKYDVDSRTEVRKELFSPYIIKKSSERDSIDIKDFLASYKYVPQIEKQNVLPKYTNRSIRKKGILKTILHNLKKDELFNYQYNYYYDYIYNNVNDSDRDEYFKIITKLPKTNESYNYFVNERKSFLHEDNKRENKYFLYTRKEIEGAHSYDFDKWSFSDFIEALLFFNDLYFDKNKENFEKHKKENSFHQFKPIDFNTLDENFVISSDNVWPKEWHGMPLGKYIEQIRMGDIDGKFHFIRKKILDFLLFDFKTEEYKHRYINFTWRKLFLGLGWYIHTRGHPVVIAPFEKINFNVFAMDFCTPEEIQGLFLGYLIIQAQMHEKIFWHNYRDRYEFLKGLELNIRSADELIF